MSLKIMLYHTATITCGVVGFDNIVENSTGQGNV